MSKICRTFAPEFQKIMKKMQYIQPKMDTVVMPERAMMEFQSSPNLDPHYTPAPTRGGYSPVPGNE